MQRDVVVLGAGIVGLATALKIQEKGRSVALVDRAGAGEATSFGNAGIIERASIYPYAFPRRIPDLVRYALNGTPEAHYHLRFLPVIAPWLARYWWHSSAQRHEQAMRAALPLIERSLAEHEPLIAAAGAEGLVRRSGWIKLFRDEGRLDRAVAETRRLAGFGGLPLLPLLGLSTLIQVASPDDLFLYAKASGSILAAGFRRAPEVLVGGLFALATSLLLLVPLGAVLLLGRERVLPRLEASRRWLFAHGDPLVGLVSLGLGGYLAWQGIEGLRLA
jgi:hypothetical protein